MSYSYKILRYFKFEKNFLYKGEFWLKFESSSLFLNSVSMVDDISLTLSIIFSLVGVFD